MARARGTQLAPSVCELVGTAKVGRKKRIMGSVCTCLFPPSGRPVARGGHSPLHYGADTARYTATLWCPCVPVREYLIARPG